MNKSNLQNNQDGISRWETPRLVESQDKGENPEENRSEDEIKLQAFEEGHKLGYQAGLEKASKEMVQKLSLINNFLQALSQPFHDQNLALAEDIANLSGQIAKGLVRRELRTEPETIMALVRDTVLALNARKQKIDIHLNPQTAKIIREIVNIDSQEQSWSIIDDPLVPRSDCKVSCQDSLIDADLQSRINIIITQFLGDERSENRQ